MEMEEMYLENTLNVICHGCLSNDRKISALGEYSETYEGFIANPTNYIYSINNIRLCWECKAMLKKFKLFQQQLHAAQDTLMQMLYQVECYPETLSKLSTVNKYDYDHYWKYIEPTTTNNKESVNIVIKTIKTENDSDISIKEETILDDNNDVDDNVSDCKDEMYSTNCETENVESPIEEKPELEVKPDEAQQDNDMKAMLKRVYLYKEYATVITEEKDWGNVETYFTMTTFGEAEMEEHFLCKERKDLEYTHFKNKCIPCQLGYKRIIDMKRHNDLKHQKSKSNLNTFTTPKRTIKCSFCNKRQSSLSSLELHWRSHTPVARCTMCGEYCPPSGMQKHLMRVHSPKYACLFCKSKFGNIEQVITHYRTMHRYFICDYCNQKCRSKRKLEIHIRAQHTTTKCKECNRVFASKRICNDHWYYAHRKRKETPKELRYCVECDKQYKTMFQYDAHCRQIHKAEKQSLPCPDCDKVFTNKYNLRYHYDFTHLKKTKYYCESCDKYFHNPGSLKYHIARVHNKLPAVKNKICDLCGRAFETKAILINHRRTHTGERPHQCPHCSASFIQKTAMRTHCKTQHKDAM